MHGQVSGDYAVWDWCAHHVCKCTVATRSTGHTTKVPNTFTRQMSTTCLCYSAAAMAHLAPIGHGRHRHVKLVEWVESQPLNILAEFGPGRDLTSTTQTVPDPGRRHRHLLRTQGGPRRRATRPPRRQSSSRALRRRPSLWRAARAGSGRVADPLPPHGVLPLPLPLPLLPLPLRLGFTLCPRCCTNRLVRVRPGVAPSARLFGGRGASPTGSRDSSPERARRFRSCRASPPRSAA